MEEKEIIEKKPGLTFKQILKNIFLNNIVYKVSAFLLAVMMWLFMGYVL
jgi:hypothetical protein